MLGGTLLSSLPVAAQNEKKPNVLLVMCDDLIAFDGIYLDHPDIKTPNLDRLRQRSVCFTNANSAAPVSGPSRAAMFTGIYPHVSQNYGFDHWFKNPVLSQVKSLFVHLGDNGYNVYGTGKLFHHNRADEFTEYGHRNYMGPLPFNGKKTVGHPSVPEPFRSVGRVISTYGSLADIPDVKPTSKAPGYKGWYDEQRKKPFRYVSDDDRDLFRDEEHAQWVINLIDELETGKSGDKPFFIGLGFSKPHTPLVAPQKYFDMYPLESIRMPERQPEGERNLGYLEENVPKNKGFKHYRAMEASYPDNVEYGLRKYVQAYMACVTFVDEIIGTVLDKLENSSFADNTVVIFCSDHGYEFGQKNFLFKNTLWETSSQVPYYVYYPGKDYLHGVEVEHPVSLMDIYPTINDICGVGNNTARSETAPELSGHSVLPFVREGDAAHWDGPEVALTVVGNPETLEPDQQNYSVRSKDFRYILYSNGKEELYDCRQDPHEWKNLAQDLKYAYVKADLRRQLEALISCQ